MKRNTKKLLACIAAATLCTANIHLSDTVPVFKSNVISASAAEETDIIESGLCGVDAHYTIDENGILTVTGTGGIDNSAFESNMLIKHAFIEDGITSIGGNVFLYCRNMETITVAGSVKTIGPTGIGFCSNLKTITLEEGVERLGMRSLASNSSLKTVYIPSTVNYICEAFYGDYNLDEIYCYSDIRNTSWMLSGGGYELKKPQDGRTICYVPAEYYLYYIQYGFDSKMDMRPIGSYSINVDITETFNSPIGNSESSLVATREFDLNHVKSTFSFIDRLALYSSISEEFNVDIDLLHQTKDVVMNNDTTEEVLSALSELFDQRDSGEVVRLIRAISCYMNKSKSIMFYKPAGSILLEELAPEIGFPLYSMVENISVPEGLTITDGIISGIPEAAGDFTTSVPIVANDQYLGTLDYNFHIAQAEPEVSVALNKEKVTTRDVLTEDDFTVESSVPGVVTFENIGSKLPEGETEITWTFTPDSPNYTIVTGTIDINVETYKVEMTDILYGTTIDLSAYDLAHINRVLIKFEGQADSTTNGSIVLGQYVSETVLNNITVNGNTVDINIDQYSLESAPDTLTIYDWYNTASTLGDIESVTFYYIDNEEVNIAEDSVIIQNTDGETNNHFDLSEYDYENVQSVTLVFDGITYGGSGAIISGENNDVRFNFNMDRTNNYSVTVDVNGTLTDSLSFSNYYNLKNLSYIALNY